MTKIIVTEGPVFYAQGDENAFFYWLKSIKAIKRVVGRGKLLEITLGTSRLSENQFGEIAALFERYRLDKRLLIGLLRKDAHWAQNKSLYWYDEVFGRSRRSGVKRRSIVNNGD